jgi:hypothetical protein
MGAIAASVLVFTENGLKERVRDRILAEAWSLCSYASALFGHPKERVQRNYIPKN